jgi:hypothetical protein
MAGLQAVTPGKVVAPVGLIKQMKGAATAAEQRHQRRQQWAAQLRRLLDAQQAIGDLRQAGLDPALAVGLGHGQPVLLDRARQLADF